MKKIILFSLVLSLASCGIWRPYTRPEVTTDGLYRSAAADGDTVSVGNLSWREVFTDPDLQELIDEALRSNTDLRSAALRVEEAEATLRTARLAFLPSFNLAPQGGVSSFDGSAASWSYTVPLAASWEVDLFGRLFNNKRQAKALYAQSEDYRQAVQTRVIASVANLYFTLLMLDEQYRISEQTVKVWRKSVETMRSLKEAGMTNEAAVSQSEANCYAVETSLHDLKQSIFEAENALSVLLGSTPGHIERGRLAEQVIPEELSVGIPVQLLSNRPDVRAAEDALMNACYVTAGARSALYPSLSLSGTAGWTNSLGSMVANPGKLILNAAGSLVQPLFNAGANRARLKIAEAQQEESRLAFQQAVLNAGQEVNDALAKCQTARSKAGLRRSQIEALERAEESTRLLMQHTSTTYLEVLTAQQSLLSARLSEVTDRFDELQGFVSLYSALGGGRQN